MSTREFDSIWKRAGGKEDICRTIQRHMNMRKGTFDSSGWRELKKNNKERLKTLWEIHVV